jgi:predicted nucleic acid-binding protein
LIDSSIFIAAERGDPALRSTLALLVPEDGDLFVSAVTVLELLHGVHRASPEKRAAREAYVENALRTFPILVFDEPAARIFASIDAALSAAGSRRGRRSYNRGNSAGRRSRRHHARSQRRAP